MKLYFNLAIIPIINDGAIATPPDGLCHNNAIMTMK
jgi:hypothetical protein